MIHINFSPSKKILLLLLFGFISSTGSAQGLQAKSDFWNKVRYGGGLGLGFGNNTFNVAIAPSAIYQANDYFAAGVSLSFNYSKFRESKLTAYGGTRRWTANTNRPSNKWAKRAAA
jgi:hypothetical protein